MLDLASRQNKTQVWLTTLTFPKAVFPLTNHFPSSQVAEAAQGGKNNCKLIQLQSTLKVAEIE